MHQSILTFTGVLLSVLISAYCIHKLATIFKTEVSFDNAVKLVGYSYTPTWLAGVFYILPSLSILVFIAGIYSLYIL